jgi:hypothetical protein
MVRCVLLGVYGVRGSWWRVGGVYIRSMCVGCMDEVYMTMFTKLLEMFWWAIDVSYVVKSAMHFTAKKDSLILFTYPNCPHPVPLHFFPLLDTTCHSAF